MKSWMARIKRLSSNCNFGDKLEHYLTNKFICGLRGDAFDRVCEKDENITLEKAMTLALKYKEDDNNPSERAVNVIRNKHQRTTSTRGDADDVECYTCGKKGHIKPKCRFRNAICINCRKNLATVCRIKTKHFMEEKSPCFQQGARK